MITIDLDVFKRFSNNHYYAVHVVQKIMFNLLTISPYKVRVSASGKGLHIVLPIDNEVVRECHDDYCRFKADQEREKLGLFTNILFKIKDDKKAGEWKYIKSEIDVVEFIQEFFRLNF